MRAITIRVQPRPRRLADLAERRAWQVPSGSREQFVRLLVLALIQLESRK